MKPFCRIYYRVPFSETDAMGIVHHSNHPKYMERGRVEFLRHIEMGYSDVMKMGIHFPVTEMQLTYKKPIAFDSWVLVETKITSLTRVRLSFSYKIFLVDKAQEDGLFESAYSGGPVLLGETQHCSVNDAGRPVEMPAPLQEKLAAVFEGDRK